MCLNKPDSDSVRLSRRVTIGEAAELAAGALVLHSACIWAKDFLTATFGVSGKSCLNMAASSGLLGGWGGLVTLAGDLGDGFGIEGVFAASGGMAASSTGDGSISLVSKSISSSFNSPADNKASLS